MTQVAEKNREPSASMRTLTGFTLTSALGAGVAAHELTDKSGLAKCDFPGADHLDTWVGRVAALEDIALPATLQAYQCRNHQMALLALEQDGFIAQVQRAITRYGAQRVGVIVGTSTSGIGETEKAYLAMAERAGELPSDYDYLHTHNIGSLASFVSHVLGATGYQLVISTACSSSAKVFASADRAIHAGLCDAVIVGGVDTLCLTTLCGFSSLQLTSSKPCRPCDINRDGISIGEAAGFALIESAGEGPLLLGYGESSDAYHMSSPHPEGDGAFLAMQHALDMAGASAEQVDYINLHGTGTPANDVSECLAVARLFGLDVPCSSTKGYVGHTLGAAGIVESLLSCMQFNRRSGPINLNLETSDPAIRVSLISPPLLQENDSPISMVLTNSFGFGGSNCSLLFGQSS